MKRPTQSSRKAFIDKKQNTLDGFASFNTRVGYGADNNISNSLYTFNLLTRNRLQLEAGYRGSWLIGNIVDAVAEDMTRTGITINHDESPEEVEQLTRVMTRMGIWGDLCDTIKWARLYGGAIAIIMLPDQDQSKPLDITTVGKGQFKGLSVYDRWMIQPSMDELIEDGAEYGLPKYYTIVGGFGKAGTKIHYSRVIRMEGIRLPYYQAITEMYWGESVIERIYDRLLSFDNTTMGIANLVDRAYLRTVSVDGLREILAAGGKAEEGLVSMFAHMRQLQTNEGLTLIDKNDTLQALSYSFGGLDNILIQFGQQIAGASGIPLVRLFGQSPAGMNATGDSDMRMYYDTINSKQESMMREGILKILTILYRSMYAKDVPESFNFTFNSLWQKDESQNAIIAKSNADTILEIYNAGIIDRDVALAELKQQSTKTGMFTNITDEMIAEAQNEPPMPMVENEADTNESK